jgi:hypothetical protein
MKKNDWKSAHLGLLLVVILIWSLAACSTTSPSSDNTNRHTQQPAKPKASFINRVWKVNKSNSIAPGHLYIFLSDGTLVITSPQSKPTFGSWKSSDGSLTMIEESVPYKVEILKLSDSEFQIRINNPGEPVEIEFVLATEAEGSG